MKLMFFGLGATEIIVIALVALLFFGGRKLPELMSGLGKGIKSFREGMNGQSSTDAQKELERKKESDEEM